MKEKESKDAIFEELEDSLRIYSSLNIIFKKLLREEKIASLSKSFQEILQGEIKFATTHLSKMSTESLEELKIQVYKNIFIFKENLKTIVSSMSTLKSRQDLEERS